MQVKQVGIGRPPIIHPWYSKDRGGGGGGNRGWGGGDRRNNWGNNRDNRGQHHRDRSRDGGGGERYRGDYRDNHKGGYNSYDR